jgi:Txe/YoeB family toxin of Txe-Axe toxin-antitoxin module
MERVADSATGERRDDRDDTHADAAADQKTAHQAVTLAKHHGREEQEPLQCFEPREAMALGIWNDRVNGRARLDSLEVANRTCRRSRPPTV